MMKILKRLFTSEKGVATVLVAMSMVALMGMAALAVDIGRAYVKRSTLQTAADAGALAGANSLLAFGNDLETLRAIVSQYANRNMVPDDNPSAALNDADIVFMKDGVVNNTDPNQVEVTITLSNARGNPFPLYFGSAIGIPRMDISVVSRAGIVGVCSSKCVKPFVVPTQFTWDDTAAPGTKYYNNEQFDVESPEELGTVQITGYSQEDIGTEIIIKPGDPSLSITPGQYNLVDLPPVNKGVPTRGAAMVQENIEGCTGSSSEATVGPGDEMLLEPGNSKGPVKAGVTSLMNEDPYARWDADTNSIKDSSFSDPMDSPRVAIIAFYDPRYPPISGRNTIKVHEMGAFFIEEVTPQGNVHARFINTVATDPDSDNSDDCLLRMSRVLLDSGRQ